MNKLLPSIEELKPITKELNTFYECGFNRDFHLLSEQKQLKIICDMVKETIYPDCTPNPETELEELRGDAFTACEVAIAYLKELDIVKNIEYVIGRKRCFDREETDFFHPLLLVEGKSGRIYQFDATPFVGYQYGVVEPIENPIYDSYEEVTDEIKDYIRTFKEIFYLEKTNQLKKDKAKDYMEKCVISLIEIPILRKQSKEALKIIVKYLEDGLIKNRVEEIIKEDPYHDLEEKNRMKQRELLEKQIREWQEELEELKHSKQNPKRQLELSQWIIQEGKKIHPELERTRIINGERITLSHINPRVLYELGLNTIFLKTSAYFLECDQRIREELINQYPIAAEYSINLSKPSEQTGIKPMLFSHPLGENCARSLNGRTDVILLQADSDTIYKKKKELRNEICGPLWGKELIWYDNEPILWDPMITNIIHGSDHAPEAALHFLVGNPEHQNMTRFMMPNPKLKVKTKKI